VARRTGERYQQARAHHGLASACDATGQHGSGREHWQRALDIYTSLGVPEAAQMTTIIAEPAPVPGDKSRG
jgi:hypothetical protein